MKRLFSRFLRSAVILSLSVVSILSTGIFYPRGVQAANFGGPTDNGTANYMTANWMGIGTTTPTKILHVTGTGPGTVPLFQRASDSAGFIIERTATNRWVLGVNESAELGNGFVLSTIPIGTTSIPRLLVMQDGRVGINTINPDTYSKLHVVNNDLNGTAVRGECSNGIGVLGHSSSDGDGINASSISGNGVWGQSGTGYGIYGFNTSTGNYGYLGANHEGVYGYSDNGTGVYGYSPANIGVYGKSDNLSSYAGYFEGNTLATGTMTATKMAYSAPRTHYFSVPAASFTPQNSGLGYSKVLGVAGAYITDSSGYMYAPVYLPDGAVVTQFTGYYFDNSASDLSISLKRQGLMGFNTAMASVASALTPGYGSASTTSITTPTISNNGYAYFVEAYWATGNGANLEVTGAVITYTISEAE